jgi:uncharacterized damage-inducible protein DinB
MISLETSLKHMAWSNQKVFTFFSEQSEDVFGLTAAEGEWPIGQILTHLAGSGEWYRYCLNKTEWTDLKPIINGSVATEYLKIMAELDEVLIAAAGGPELDLSIEGENGLITATTSLILSQSVMHAAEHKGQIATILKQHGRHLDLDALDVWSFIDQTKNK